MKQPKHLFCLLLCLLATSLTTHAQNVAKIGETEYANLIAAFNAVPNNGETPTTVTLLTDCEAMVVLLNGPKNVLLDLDGHTLTLTKGQRIWLKEGDLTYDSTKSSPTIFVDGSFFVVGGASLTITGNGTINGGYSTNPLFGNVGTITIENGTIEPTTGTYVSALFNRHGGQIIVNGGDITSTTSHTIDNAAGCKVIVNNGTITAKGESDNALNNSGEIEINGGTITGGPVPTGSEVVCCAINNHTATSVVTINGGHILAGNDSDFSECISATSGTYNIYGGTFNRQVSTFNGNGHVVIYTTENNNGDGTWTYAPTTPYVAKIGSDRYSSLYDAVAAAQEGDVVVMINDSEETQTSVVDKAITIDLNGKTVTREGLAIQVNADLTLTDSSDGAPGTIRATGTSSKGMQVANNANVTIEKVNVNSDFIGVYFRVGNLTMNSGSITGASAPGACIYEGSNLTMNGGTITGNNYAVHFLSAGGTLNMNGGTLNSGATGIEAQKGGVVNLNGGTLNAEDWGVTVWNDNTTLNLDGTAIKSNGIGISTNGETTANGTIINIHSGSITAGVGIYHPGMGQLTIDGGTIEASTGVVMRNGKLDISGGTIHATGAANAYDFHNSGSSDTGDALQIESSNYGEHISKGETFLGEAYTGTIVSITGGIFISDNAKAVASYVKEDDPLQTSDGTARCLNFISEGWYSNVIPDNYCAYGVEPDPDAHTDAPDSRAQYTVLHVSVKAYYVKDDGTKVDGEDVAITNWTTLQQTYPNAVALTSSASLIDFAKTNTNVIMASKDALGETTYACPNFVLVDYTTAKPNVSFYSPVDFTAVKLNYTREDIAYGQYNGEDTYNSVCLPFAFSGTDVNGAIYTFSNYNAKTSQGEQVFFTNRTSVAAGIPCIIHCDNADDWNVNLERVLVVGTPVTSTNMQGAFIDAAIGTGHYKLADEGNKYTQTKESSHCYAFRSYLDIDNTLGFGLSGAPALQVVIANETTGIDSLIDNGELNVDNNGNSIYTLDGRIVSGKSVNDPLPRGVYVINGKKVIVK